MKVSELVVELLKCPQDAMVMEYDVSSYNKYDLQHIDSVELRKDEEVFIEGALVRTEVVVIHG